MRADWEPPSGTPLELSSNPALPGSIRGPRHGQLVPLLILVAPSWESLFCVPAPFHGTGVLEILLGSAADHFAFQLHSLTNWACPALTAH